MNVPKGEDVADTPCIHELRVRLFDQAQKVELNRVTASINLAEETITFSLPDGIRAQVDVVTARALQMILLEGVYGSLRPNGPQLTVERNNGDGW